MIISFKLTAAAVVLGFCAVSMSGVVAQQSTLPPVTVINFHGDASGVGEKR